jgi:maleate cis-trans isomerase
MNASLAQRTWPKPRARIGLVIPSVNTLTEPQFNRYTPRDVEFHVSRTRIYLDRPLADQTPEILSAAELVAECGCDLILYHCTGMSMGSGRAAEQLLIKQIGERTGVPAASTATAIVTAFRALGIHKVVLVSPYEQSINDLERKFLAEVDVDVLVDRALALPIPDGMCGATPDVWIDTTVAAARPDADAYFLSCTNIQSIDAVTNIEARLGRPAVTSNQAAMWYALRRCGIRDEIPALGRLFRLDLPEMMAQPTKLASGGTLGQGKHALCPLTKMSTCSWWARAWPASAPHLRRPTRASIPW